MSVPTSGETYSRLMEHLRLAQEDAAMLSHLAAANSDAIKAKGWRAISEAFKLMQRNVTDLAIRGRH